MKRIAKIVLGFIFIILFLVIIIGMIKNTEIKQGSLEFTDKWQGNFITIDGEKIRYVNRGSGKSILLIHGTPGSIEDWDSIIDSLAVSNNVIAYDRLGNGFSSANSYTYTLDENVELANKIIEKFNLNKVLIIGHSYGGSIATKMATQNNNRIKSFIVISAPLYNFESETIYKILSAPIIGKGITVIGSKVTAENMIKNGLYNAFGKDSLLVNSKYLAVRNKLWSQPKVLYATSNIRGNYDKDLKNTSLYYKNITKKISFLVGNADDPLIFKDANKISEEIAHSKLYIYKDIAHYVQFSKPIEVLEIIKEHLKN